MTNASVCCTQSRLRRVGAGGLWQAGLSGSQCRVQETEALVGDDLKTLHVSVIWGGSFSQCTSLILDFAGCILPSLLTCSWT